MSEDAHRLLRRIQAESAPLMVVFQREQEAAQVSLDFARRHGVDARAICHARRSGWARANRTAALRPSRGS